MFFVIPARTAYLLTKTWMPLIDNSLPVLEANFPYLLGLDKQVPVELELAKKNYPSNITLSMNHSDKL